MHAAQYVHYHFMLHALVCFVRKLCGKKPGLWQSAALAADPGMLPPHLWRTRECYRRIAADPGMLPPQLWRTRECYRRIAADPGMLPPQLCWMLFASPGFKTLIIPFLAAPKNVFRVLLIRKTVFLPWVVHTSSTHVVQYGTTYLVHCTGATCRRTGTT